MKKSPAKGGGEYGETKKKEQEGEPEGRANKTVEDVDAGKADDEETASLADKAGENNQGIPIQGRYDLQGDEAESQ